MRRPTEAAPRGAREGRTPRGNDGAADACACTAAEAAREQCALLSRVHRPKHASRAHSSGTALRRSSLMAVGAAYGDWRVDTLHVALLDQDLACLGTQSLDLRLLYVLTPSQLLNLAIEVGAAAGHACWRRVCRHSATRSFSRARVHALLAPRWLHARRGP